MREVAIEMEDVRYVYPDGSVALDGVNLRIMKHERVAIMGPNGAGKTTLLMLINGLFTPSKGNVNVLGLPVKGSNLREVRMKVGLAFQNPDDQLFCPTLWEDVTFGPLNMGLPEEEITRRAREALKAVGLVGYEEKPPHHLSVGEKKKAALATVLAMKPEILILDEPTANLDPRSRTELIELLDNLHRTQEITLIVATHDVNFVPMIMDRVYVLNSGRIIAEGSVRAVFSNVKLMKEANLEPPAIAQLFSLLSEQDGLEFTESLPFTIKDALHELHRLLKRGRIHNNLNVS
ncbi:ATP-binding cassette domain-containing protein [Candidatus Bathyarchaeota archaeon]|nr:ATP-binding cassette domain-containing protein [Candidatus Bathyarchaeota archaeon]